MSVINDTPGAGISNLVEFVKNYFTKQRNRNTLEDIQGEGGVHCCQTMLIRGGGGGLFTTGVQTKMVNRHIAVYIDHWWPYRRSTENTGYSVMVKLGIVLGA